MSIRLSSPEHFTAAVPYMVGYKPSEQVVAVFLDDSGAVAVTMVTKIDAILEDTDRWILTLKTTMERANSGYALFAIYCETLMIGNQYESILNEVKEFLNIQGIVHCIDQWYTELCPDGDCGTCMKYGVWSTVSEEVHTLIAAEFISEGIAVAGSRADIEAEFEPEEFKHEVLCEMLLDQSIAATQNDRDAAVRDMIEFAVSQLTDNLDDMSDESLLKLSIFCSASVNVRDNALYSVLTMNTDDLVKVYSKLAHAARITATGMRDAVATMAAVAIYMKGDGGRANVAIQAALDDNSNYVFAQMLSSAFRAAIPPHVVTEILTAAQATDQYAS